jgi:hypothetical protein
MKLHYQIMILLLISNLANSQTLKGIVSDSLTNKPLPFVNITFIDKDFGVYTNENGSYQIKIIDSICRIQISSVGYFTKLIDIKNKNISKEIKLDIYLVPKTEELEEIVLSNKVIKYSNKKYLGLKKKSKVRSSFQFGTELCSLIKNPYNKNGKVESVILSLSKSLSKPDYICAYNIKFYEYDQKTKLPGKELYYDNLIIEPVDKTYNLKINLDSIDIDFPKNGICIGVEIANTKYVNPKSSGAFIAPSINFTESMEDTSVLSWIRYRNKNWIINTQKTPHSNNNNVNSLVNIVVRIEE